MRPNNPEPCSAGVACSQVGAYKIVFQAEPPDPNAIPMQDLLGVTVILLSCFYRDREFIRVGYYINSE